MVTVKNADHLTAGTFTVVVSNSAPTLHPTNVPNIAGYTLVRDQQIKSGDGRGPSTTALLLISRSRTFSRTRTVLPISRKLGKRLT